MTAIERYDSTRPPIIAEFDSWAPMLGAVAELANKIAGTDFVPESMRGKPAAVAAAILAGREMGIGPMTALQNIHVIKGRPGQSAQLMRSLVLAAGHELRYVETTDTRCIMEGRRAGEEEWTRVQYTADQARRARIDLGTYPEDKLVARASSRLCRRKFADCLAGMAYSIEELEDGDTDQPATITPIVTAAPTRKAKRNTPIGVTAATRTEAKEAPVDTVPPPPLPGEDDEEDEQLEDDDAEQDDNPAEEEPKISDAQSKKIHAILNGFGIKDRDHRIDLTRRILSRDTLETTNDLTVTEASTLLDMLDTCRGTDNPVLALEHLAQIGRPT